MNHKLIQQVNEAIAKDVFQGKGFPNLDTAIKQIQLDARHSALSEAAELSISIPVQPIPFIPIAIQKAILALRDKKES